MKEFRRFRFLTMLPLLIWGLIFGMCSPAAAGENYGDIEIEIDAPEKGESEHGYYEFVVTVDNHSPETPHEVEIRFLTGSSWTRGNVIREMSRTVQSPPGSRIIFSMFQLPLPMHTQWVHVLIDGTTHPGNTGVPYAKHAQNYYGKSKHKKCLLVGRSVSQADLIRRLDMAAGSDVKITPKDILLNEYRKGITAGGDNWLSFSRFDGVFMTQKEIEALPESEQNALLAYVKCGGTLGVLGNYRAAASHSLQRKTYPDGTVLHRMGFGYCLLFSSPMLRDISFPRLNLFYRLTADSQKPWLEDRSASRANRDFRVTEDTGVNIKGFFIGMLLFIILVGPVNFLILFRMKKRIWLLWTIPLLSVLTSAGVFSYAVLSEGLGSDLKSRAFILLDEKRKEAVSLGMNAYYCRMTPGGGLLFSQRTEVTPMVNIDYSKGTSRTVDWTGGQRLTSGWVAARIPAHFRIRKHETRRERIHLSRNDDHILTLINGLGADILRIWAADAGGMVYTGGPTEAGAETVMKRTSRIVEAPNILTPIPEFPRFRFRDPEEKSEEERLLKILAPGTYLAVIDSNPFVEKGLEELKEEDVGAVVYGIMSREGGE